MLLILVFDTVKLAAFVPDFPTVSVPVAWFPVLVTVTVLAVCAPYPATAAGKV
jgi:hypothetical protein